MAEECKRVPRQPFKGSSRRHHGYPLLVILEPPQVHDTIECKPCIAFRPIAII